VKLSILDQSPISAGKTAQEALHTSVKLAQLGEELGYERFWIAEHHDLFGLACPNPDVMLGVIGAQTKQIRIGAGAVLLPYYKPFRVAETYNLLATLFPDRVDLGLGRAPGGSAEVSLALSDNYLKQVREYPERIEELLGFLHGRYPADHPYGKISPTPVPETPPETWLLGTSEKSAILAAEKGMDYAFGHFMTDSDGPEIVKRYRENFAKKPGSERRADEFSHGKDVTKSNTETRDARQVNGLGHGKDVNSRVEPRVIVAVSVICAATTERAEELALSSFLWSIQQEKQVDHHVVPSVEEAKNYTFTEEEQEKMEKMKNKMIIGNPPEVKEQLVTLKEQYGADEIMVVTIIHDAEAKFESYRLLALECWKVD